MRTWDLIVCPRRWCMSQLYLCTGLCVNSDASLIDRALRQLTSTLLLLPYCPLHFLCTVLEIQVQCSHFTLLSVIISLLIHSLFTLSTPSIWYEHHLNTLRRKKNSRNEKKDLHRCITGQTAISQLIISNQNTTLIVVVLPFTYICNLYTYPSYNKLNKLNEPSSFLTSSPLQAKPPPHLFLSMKIKRYVNSAL